MPASAVSKTRQGSPLVGACYFRFVWVRFTALPRARFTNTPRSYPGPVPLPPSHPRVILCIRKCRGPPRNRDYLLRAREIERIPDRRASIWMTRLPRGRVTSNSLFTIRMRLCSSNSRFPRPLDSAKQQQQQAIVPRYCRCGLKRNARHSATSPSRRQVGHFASVLRARCSISSTERAREKNDIPACTSRARTRLDHREVARQPEERNQPGKDEDACLFGVDVVVDIVFARCFT